MFILKRSLFKMATMLRIARQGVGQGQKQENQLEGY